MALLPALAASGPREPGGYGLRGIHGRHGEPQRNAIEQILPILRDQLKQPGAFWGKGKMCRLPWNLHPKRAWHVGALTKFTNRREMCKMQFSICTSNQLLHHCTIEF